DVCSSDLTRSSRASRSSSPSPRPPSRAPGWTWTTISGTEPNENPTSGPEALSSGLLLYRPLVTRGPDRKRRGHEVQPVISCGPRRNAVTYEPRLPFLPYWAGHMGFWDKLRGELIDIVEWTDTSSDTLVHRFERYNNEIKYGAKLVVREGQEAVFVDEGKLA